MIGIELTQVNFGMQKLGEDMVLAFQDPQTGIQVRIMFGGDGWGRFKRAVEKDGKTPDLVIANGLPRMDVPRGA